MTKYTIDQKVFHQKYGAGVIAKIDEPNKRFRYFVRCKDGTIVWCSENDISDVPFKKVAKKEK